MDDNRPVDLTPLAQERHGQSHGDRGHQLSRCDDADLYYQIAARDLLKANPGLEGASFVDGKGRKVEITRDHPDFWPVVFDSADFMPKTFARIADVARNLGVGWKIKQRPDSNRFQLDIDDLPQGFAQTSGSFSSHATIDDAIDFLAGFLADAIDRTGSSIKWTALRFAASPSTYNFRELRQRTGHAISAGGDEETKMLGGTILHEAVGYLLRTEFTGNQAPSEYYGICIECKGHAGLVLPGDPAPRPGHQRNCKVALFLNKYGDA